MGKCVAVLFSLAWRQMDGAGRDVNFLQWFQGLCVKQGNGGSLCEGHPNPSAWMNHVANTAALIRVSFKALQYKEMHNTNIILSYNHHFVQERHNLSKNRYWCICHYENQDSIETFNLVYTSMPVSVLLPCVISGFPQMLSWMYVTCLHHNLLNYTISYTYTVLYIVMESYQKAYYRHCHR